MDEPTARRTSRLTRNIVFLVPAVLATLVSLLLRTEPASLIAPALGPWAGVLYGHRGCTLGTHWPGRSLALLALGLLAFAWIPRTRPGPWRTLALTVAAGCAGAWEFAALLSVLNTTI